jgi:hypothetical protein
MEMGYRVGSASETLVRVGETTRHDLDPPFHAVDENGDALCGAQINHVAPGSDWDTDILNGRCLSCEGRAAK